MYTFVSRVNLVSYWHRLHSRKTAGDYYDALFPNTIEQSIQALTTYFSNIVTIHQICLRAVNTERTITMNKKQKINSSWLLVSCLKSDLLLCERIPSSTIPLIFNYLCIKWSAYESARVIKVCLLKIPSICMSNIVK